jgi:hypothetical protein
MAIVAFYTGRYVQSKPTGAYPHETRSRNSQRSSRSSQSALFVIFAQVRAIPTGIKIKPDYRVKGLGKSRGEEALVYLVPNRNGGTPSETRVCCSEWETAYQHLLSGGQMTNKWFAQNIPKATKDGMCSFRFIGEVFVLLEVATRVDGAKGSKYIRRLQFPSVAGGNLKSK